MEQDGRTARSGDVPMRVRAAATRRSASRSATRALDVLERFGELRRPLRAVEVARALELSASSTNQLLKTMVDSAHLVFDAATKLYAPSPRLTRFAGWMVAHYGADQRVRGAMHDLERATGETITLASPDDLFMLILDRIGPAAAMERPERGLRVSIFGSALGTAYLASLPPAAVARLAARARLGPAERVGALERVAQARADGHAAATSPDGGACSLAAALPGSGHPAPLVLGLAGPAGRVTARAPALAAALRAAVAGLGGDAVTPG